MKEDDMASPQSRKPRSPPSLFHQRAKLVAYLTTESSASGRSSLGPQLERAAWFAFGSVPCTECGGVILSRKPGCGFVPSDPKLRRKGARRPVSDLEAVFFQEIGIDPDELPPPADMICPRCHGWGFVQRTSRCRARGRITARPTGSSIPVGRGGYVLNENSVKLCGSVGRWLREVFVVDPAAVATIEIYHAYGETRVPLWLRTPPGLGLLRRSELGRCAVKERDLDAALRVLDNERNAQEAMPDRQRGALLAAADREVLLEVESAARVWNEIVPTEDEETERDFEKAVGL